MIRYGILLFICSICVSTQGFAQCFASPGNPVGGTANMGTMQKNSVRIASNFQHSYSDTYFEGHSKYTGPKTVIQNAHYNFMQLLGSYGITDVITLEAEMGYFIQKKLHYKQTGTSVGTNGLSNSVVSLKYNFFQNDDTRFSIVGSIGANIPFSQNMKQANGVVLPLDVQPSTGSFGAVWQTYILKENSFRGERWFYTNRIEYYNPNKENVQFGTALYQSIYYSKHFDFQSWKLHDWTGIIQCKNLIKLPNYKDDAKIKASGGYTFWIIPQINVFVKNTWNISTFISIPIYQYVHDIQLGNRYGWGLQITRDFGLKE